MGREKTSQIVYAALFTALIVIAVYFFRIPSFDGRLVFHLGETMMIVAAYTLGKRDGALAAGVGSALADLLMGVPLWAPVSFVIHGLQVWLIAVLGDGQLRGKDWLAMSCGAVIVIVGYSAFAWFFYGIGAVPVSLVGDCMQTGFGIVSAWGIMKAINRINPNLIRIQKKQG